MNPGTKRFTVCAIPKALSALKCDLKKLRKDVSRASKKLKQYGIQLAVLRGDVAGVCPASFDPVGYTKLIQLVLNDLPQRAHTQRPLLEFLLEELRSNTQVLRSDIQQLWKQRLKRLCPSVGKNWGEILEGFVHVPEYAILKAKVLTALSQIRQGRRFVFIVGRAHCGKSTLLHKCFDELLKNTGASILFMEGGQLSDSPDVSNLLNVRLSNDSAAISMLFLDGLDEWSAARRDPWVAWKSLEHCTSDFGALVVSLTNELYARLNQRGFDATVIPCGENKSSVQKVCRRLAEKYPKLKHSLARQGLKPDQLTPLSICVLGSISNNEGEIEPSTNPQCPAYLAGKVVESFVKRCTVGEKDAEKYKLSGRRYLHKLAIAASYGSVRTNLPFKIEPKERKKFQGLLSAFASCDGEADGKTRIHFHEKWLQDYLSAEALIEAIKRQDMKFLDWYYGPHYWTPWEILQHRSVLLREQHSAFWEMCVRVLVNRYQNLARKASTPFPFRRPPWENGAIGILNDLSYVYPLKDQKIENQVAVFLCAEARGQGNFLLRLGASLAYTFLREDENPVQDCVEKMGKNSRLLNRAFQCYGIRYSGFDCAHKNPSHFLPFLDRISRHLCRAEYSGFLGWDLMCIVYIYNRIRKNSPGGYEGITVNLREALGKIKPNNNWWKQFYEKACKAVE